MYFINFEKKLPGKTIHYSCIAKTKEKAKKILRDHLENMLNRSKSYLDTYMIMQSPNDDSLYVGVHENRFNECESTGELEIYDAKSEKNFVYRGAIHEH